jgi:hypothetical protein
MRGPLHFGLAQQLRQLGENGSDALRLVAREQFAAGAAHPGSGARPRWPLGERAVIGDIDSTGA